MLSYLHEVLVDMLGHEPRLAAALLGEKLAAGVPPEPVRVESAEFSDHAPTQYRADRVLVFGEGAAKVAIVAEVQNWFDQNKEWVWPAYVANLRAREACPVLLLVLCVKESVAARYNRPIELGPGSIVTPVVAGPGRIPVITHPSQARHLPELAVLSAIVHHRHPERDKVLTAAAEAFGLVEPDRGALYYDTVLAELPKPARIYLQEVVMTTQIYPYQSEFARQYFTRGQAEGRAEGLAEGEARGEANALLTVLDARGIGLTDNARARITNCTDLGLLESWLRRATTIDKAEELFD
jgi:hypothetical protein